MEGRLDTLAWYIGILFLTSMADNKIIARDTTDKSGFIHYINH